MKTTVRKEVTICDKCKAECDYPSTCLCCGIEMCHACADKHGVEYDHAVYHGGTGDGFYCTVCDTKLSSTGKDKLHFAYRAVKALRIEIKGFNEGFKSRQIAVEQRIQKLLKK